MQFYDSDKDTRQNGKDDGQSFIIIIIFLLLLLLLYGTLLQRQ